MTKPVQPSRIVMSSRLRIFSAVVAALWLGSLSAIGFMAVPLLFAHLSPAATAGTMAARLFAAQGGLSVACALFLVMAFRTVLRRFPETIADEGEASLPRAPEPVARPDMTYLAVLISGLLLALLLQLLVAPRIEARQNLALWHSLGTGMYIGQWLCALWTVVRLAGSREKAGVPPSIPKVPSGT